MKSWLVNDTVLMEALKTCHELTFCALVDSSRAVPRYSCRGLTLIICSLQCSGTGSVFFKNVKNVYNRNRGTEVFFIFYIYAFFIV